MRLNPSFRLGLALTTCIWTLACGTTTTGAGAMGSVAGSGGDPGASCPGPEGAIACNPAGTAKVRCKGGLWSDDGACEGGESCQETRANDGTGTIVATSCAVPPSGRSQLAGACARFNHCYDEYRSIGECLQFADSSLKLKPLVGQLGFLPEIDDYVLLDIGALQGCVLAASDCKGVAACFVSKVPTTTCGGASTKGCQGSVAWRCDNNLPVSVDCGDYGLPCRLLGSDPMCARLPECAPGANGPSCSGTNVNYCVTKKGVTDGVKIDCAAMGMSCLGSSKTLELDDVCGDPNAAACDKASFVERCEGSVRVRCAGGRESRLDCSLSAETCALDQEDSPPRAVCGPLQPCPTDKYGDEIQDSCDGNKLRFCDGGKMVSMDCASVGMICKSQGSNNHARCEFTNP